MKMDMKVYAHYKEEHGNEFRWRTLLQFGDSWDVIGSVVMRNPGSAKPASKVQDEDTLFKLKPFDAKCEEWHEFTADPTIKNTAALFLQWYMHNCDWKKLRGVIQVFNLFNLKNAKREDAIEQLKKVLEKSAGSDHLFTTEDDIQNILQHADKPLCRKPLYLGWGDSWDDSKGYPEQLSEKANQIFKEVVPKMKYGNYLQSTIEDNSKRFVHPYCYNEEQIKSFLSFIQNRTIADTDVLICPKR